MGLDNYKGLASEKLQRVSVGEDGKGQAQKMLFGVRVREDINVWRWGLELRDSIKGLRSYKWLGLAKL